MHALGYTAKSNEQLQTRKYLRLLASSQEQKHEENRHRLNEQTERTETPERGRLLFSQFAIRDEYIYFESSAPSWVVARPRQRGGKGEENSYM